MPDEGVVLPLYMQSSHLIVLYKYIVSFRLTIVSCQSSHFFPLGFPLFPPFEPPRPPPLLSFSILSALNFSFLAFSSTRFFALSILPSYRKGFEALIASLTA